MGLLRSETMGYYELLMQADMDWRTLNQLGKLSVIQLVDLNSDQTVFNRRYAAQIRRCEEAERRLRFLFQEQERFNIEVITSNQTAEILDEIDRNLDYSESSAQTYFENLERELGSYEERMNEQLRNYNQLKTAKSALKEKKFVLQKARETFAQQPEGGVRRYQKIAGVVERVDIDRFKRKVFRMTRGNALMLFYDIEEPVRDWPSEALVEKSVFFILFQGDEGGVLTEKIGRICDTSGIHRYGVPNDYAELEEDYYKNEENLTNSKEITKRTQDTIKAILQKLATPKTEESYVSLIEEYRFFILKQKSIYHNLNMFDLRGNIYYGQCWCPKSEESRVRNLLDEFANHPGFSSGQLRELTDIPSHQTPPTYFKLNEFTASFQEIVDTYGVPNYKEANPALFTIVTFPYLFGIMFGDVGHGLILFSFACYLIFMKDSIERNNGMFKGALSVRYLLMMMGFFAVYNGLIYNDFLGIPLDFFGTNWRKSDIRPDHYVQDSTYPFGIDPYWYKADNELVFLNSFKMKVSVVFGVIEMIAGNFFKGANAIHFRSAIDFFFEFIPQLVFMCCIFGYMIIMIFIKWASDWNYNYEDNAPNLITVLMNMFLKLGALDDQESLWGDRAGEEELQFTLLMIGLICVPLMLFPKPLILYCMHSKKEENGEEGGFNRFEDEQDRPQNEEEEFNFSEEFIYEMIETIEYTLSAISNTASYLRLWALSLAHAQLSKVFFDNCIGGAVETGNPVAVVIGFFVFANITVGVLMCMDAMECFLHALRLHWVEFENKFYKGEGVRFVPFSFEKVIGQSKEGE